MGQKKTGKHLKPFTLVKDLFDRYYGHDVARDGAALTYYLLFAIFPLLIFISTLVGLMNLDIEELMSTVSHILPEQVAGIMRSYLEYVSTSPSRQLLVFSLIFSVWFPMRATSCLMHSVRKAYGVSRPASMIGGTLRNFDSYGDKLDAMSDRTRNILCDPQTSGGLLVAVGKESEAELLSIARDAGLSLSPIGELKVKEGDSFIEVVQ